MRAIRDHRLVRFEYRKAGATDGQVRTVEPWTVRSLEGRWYLIGWDRDRQEERVFRLSRIHGSVTVTATAAPERSRTTRITLTPDSEDEVRATITIPEGAGAELRRLPGSAQLADETWLITAARSDLLSLLRRADEAVVLQEPADLVGELARSLQDTVAAHR